MNLVQMFIQFDLAQGQSSEKIGYPKNCQKTVKLKFRVKIVHFGSLNNMTCRKTSQSTTFMKKNLRFSKYFIIHRKQCFLYSNCIRFH